MRNKLFLLLLFPIVMFSQETYRHYGTQSYYYEHVLPRTGSGSEMYIGYDLFENERRIEERVSKVVDDIELKPLKLEVIFHILYTDDMQEAELVINTQLRQLNQDFNSISPPSRHPNDPLGRYIKLATNPKINFELSTGKNKDQGIASIREVSSERWRNYDDMKYEEKGGSPPLSPAEYINIWVVDLPDGMNSYSTSPYQNADLSGIVIDSRFFGTMEKGDHGYTEGKTLTHLMGNYLGLSDLWSDYEHCGDDHVSDTPLHNAQVTGCPEYRHVTTCYRDELVPSMTMNYMNNTDDSCQFMFTEGQVRRMRAILLTARPSLLK